MLYLFIKAELLSQIVRLPPCQTCRCREIKQGQWFCRNPYLLQPEPCSNGGQDCLHHTPRFNLYALDPAFSDPA
ncbi:hypothetical protein KJ909_02695 [Patescibacteria group bacterium]|nr:hypothetical protein [Patescibacteria group bacterium]